MTTQCVPNEGIIENLTRIVLPQPPKLISKAFSVSPLGGPGFTLYLMEADALAIVYRRLDHVGAGKRVIVRVDEFLIETSRLWSTDVATHVSDHFLMQMTHKALYDHKSFVSNGRTDSLPKIAAIKQRLGSCEDIGVKDISRITPLLDIFRSPRKGPDNILYFARYAGKHRIGFLEGPDQVGPLSEVDSMNTSRWRGDTDGSEDRKKTANQLTERQIGYVLNRLISHCARYDQ